ncbi:hypothetical protein Tco_1523727 [Tanacetum coccineum]
MIWNTWNRYGNRTGKKEESKALVTVDGESIDWTTHSKDDEDYALMANNNSGSEIQVYSCSSECKKSYANLKRLYDAQREQLSDASVEKRLIYQGFKKVEAQLVAHQQGQLWYEQKIKFIKIDLDDKTDVLTYHKTLLAKAQKEKDDLEDNPHKTLKNKGIIDSGCSRHMTGNKAYLADYQDINGGPFKRIKLTIMQVNRIKPKFRSKKNWMQKILTKKKNLLKIVLFLETLTLYGIPIPPITHIHLQNTKKRRGSPREVRKQIFLDICKTSIQEKEQMRKLKLSEEA